jgi:hypothetical protein
MEITDEQIAKSTVEIAASLGLTDNPDAMEKIEYGIKELVINHSSERQVDAGVMEGDSRNSGQLTVDNIKNVIENPDLMTSGCKEHLFYIKGNIIVYSKLMFNSDERYEVICADILKKPKSS